MAIAHVSSTGSPAAWLYTEDANLGPIELAGGRAQVTQAMLDAVAAAIVAGQGT